MIMKRELRIEPLPQDNLVFGQNDVKLGVTVFLFNNDSLIFKQIYFSYRRDPNKYFQSDQSGPGSNDYEVVTYHRIQFSVILRTRLRISEC